MPPESDAKSIIEAIGKLSLKVDQRFEDVEKSIQLTADRSLEHHEDARKEFTQMRGHIARLWRKVNGSDPPPPAQKEGPDGRVVEESPFSSDSLPEAHGKSPMPLDELAEKGFRIASNADMEIAALRSETMTEFAKVAKRFDTIMVVNQEQSDYAGIGKKGRDYLFSREGVKATATLIAAVTGLVAALGTCYALAKPAPAPPTPLVHETSQTQHP